MSDLGPDAGSPPPPPPPPSLFPPPPAYAPIGPLPAGWVPAAGTDVKPPRPPVPVGSILLIAGAAVMFASAFLTWYTINGVAVDGLEENLYTSLLDAPTYGPAFLMFAILALGFGVAQLAARRVLAVAILSVVFGGIGFVTALGALVDVGDFEGRLEDVISTNVDYSVGAGPWIALLGATVALAGGIATLARRRRWPAPL